MDINVLIGQIAFWEHDRFPYTLSGTITEVRLSEDIRVIVETKEFGKGHGFFPFKVLDLEKGTDLRKKLKLLEEEHYQAEKALRKQYNSQLKNLLGSSGVVHPEKYIKFSK